MVLTISAAAVFMAASVAAWAGPNDGPKYPDMATNKQYPDQRIMDHNNAAPRYAVSGANSQTANQSGRVGQAAQTGNRAVATRRHVPRAIHATRGAVPHG
jgi:hypothetical protein